MRAMPSLESNPGKEVAPSKPGRGDLQLSLALMNTRKKITWSGHARKK